MRTSRVRVYVAGPLTSGATYDALCNNMTQAFKVADHLMKHNYAPFLPHLSHYWNLISKHSWGEWLDYDEAWVEVCDAVLRLPGRSPGADREVAYATGRHIPVFDTIADLNTWRLETEEFRCYQGTTSTGALMSGPGTSGNTPLATGSSGSMSLPFATPKE